MSSPKRPTRGPNRSATLTLEDAREAIGASFPAVESTELEYLGSGWGFDAFLTADGWVFRFPRQAWCGDLFEAEQRTHQLVSRFLPPAVAIPKVRLLGRPTPSFPHRFAGHRFISGVPGDALDPSLLPALARDIAEALQAIHGIPAQEARAAAVVETDLEENGRKEWLERGLERARRLRGLHATIDSAVDWVRQISLPPPRYEGPLRFIHQDLSPEHLIADPETGRLLGILDWTDATLGDAARDFVALVTWRGWDFTEEVLRQYHLSLDDGFRERLGFMARLLSMIWLGEAHEQGSEVAKHIGWIGNAFSIGGSS